MASKAKTWGQKRGYAAGRKSVSELKAPAKSSSAVARRAGATKPPK